MGRKEGRGEGREEGAVPTGGDGGMAVEVAPAGRLGGWLISRRGGICREEWPMYRGEAAPVVRRSSEEWRVAGEEDLEGG